MTSAAETETPCPDSAAPLVEDHQAAWNCFARGLPPKRWVEASRSIEFSGRSARPFVCCVPIDVAGGSTSYVCATIGDLHAKRPARLQPGSRSIGLTPSSDSSPLDPAPRRDGPQQFPDGARGTRCRGRERRPDPGRFWRSRGRVGMSSSAHDVRSSARSWPRSVCTKAWNLLATPRQASGATPA